jgi:hypothetical protein
MDTKYKFLILFILTLIISIIYCFIIFTEKKENVVQNEIYSVQSITNILKLKQLVLEKYDYISKNSGFYEPYNKKYFDYMKNRLENSNNLTFENLVGYSMLIINLTLGYGDILPLKNSPQKTLSFQYNVGLFGWYWIYYTDVTNKCSFLFLLTRADLVPGFVNEKNNLENGESSLYIITVGCGNKYGYVSTPFTVLPGKFESNGEIINFNTLENEKGIKLNFKCNTSGNMSIDFKGKTSSGKDLVLNTNLTTNTTPKFNRKDGCYPLCKSGLGTNYWSFTNLKLGDGQNFYQIGNNKQILSTNGRGWMDRQWFKTVNPNSLYLKLIYIFSKRALGIGTYLWITIQLESVQYLIIFQGNITNLNVNTQIKTIYNTYTKDTVKFKQKCKITVKKIGQISELKGVNYPITLEIELDNGDKYISSCEETGLGYVLDPTNNIHQTSGSIIKDLQGNIVGTGLIEANNLQSSDILNENYYKVIDANYKDVPSKEINMSQKIPGILTITLFLIFIILFIVFLSFTIKHSVKKN